LECADARFYLFENDLYIIRNKDDKDAK